MGLAINGDTVHGLAIAGQSFQTINKNSDGSIVFEGQSYSKGGTKLNRWAVGSISLIQGDFRIDFSALEHQLNNEGKSLNGKTIYLIVICDVSVDDGSANGAFCTWGPLTWGKDERLQELLLEGSDDGSTISTHDFENGTFYIGRPQDIDSEDNTLVYMLYSE